MIPHLPDSPAPAPAAVTPAPHFAGPVVELDVRDELRNGREPFSRIMAAVEALAPDAVLRLRATFEPVPLFRVMAKRGFAHVARQEGAEDWSVWFHRATRDTDDVAPVGTPVGAPAPAPVGAGAAAAEEIVIDVRGLEPPEPMLRTLAALVTLPDGAVLVQRNERVPQFLLPILSERGFHYDVDDSASDCVVVRIRRAT
jgi:hypothetical protein